MATKNATKNTTKNTPATSAPPAPLTPTQVRELRDTLGVSRTALSQLTGLSLSRVWASEQEGKDVADEHRAAVTAALREIEKSGPPDHLKPKEKPAKVAKPKPATRTELVARLSGIALLLDEATHAKSSKEIRALVDQARALADAGPAPADPTTSPDSSPDTEPTVAVATDTNPEPTVQGGPETADATDATAAPLDEAA